MNPGSAAIEVSRSHDGRISRRPDAVAVEEPLEIRLGYSTPEGRALLSLAITMRTPGDDENLVAGFLYGESIVTSAGDIAAIETCGAPSPDTGRHNVLRVELAASVPVDIGRLQRHFYTTSSCGVCGKASLDALHATGLVPAGSGPRFTEAVLPDLPGQLRAAQPTFADTGGLHAAGAFDTAGRLLEVAEDVGRHNALDKLIGRLLFAGRLPAAELGVLVSGRASFELMQKALAAGMPLLAAVGAPSSLAVSLAREFNMTLVGFLRGDTFNVYAGVERLCP